MDWLQAGITFASGLVLGFMSGFVWPHLRETITERKENRARADRKARILKDLDLIASDVMAAVQVNPHGVQNKNNWVCRLQQFADQYDEDIGELAGYVKRISYKIEDSTFDHSTLGNPPYCCDQVENDLALLRLCIFPIVAKDLKWGSEELEVKENQMLEIVWRNFQEIIMPPLRHPDPETWHEEYKSAHLKQWHTEWKAYEFKIGPSENLAMAPYVNHERKTAYQD
jgi:hypothetical protein